MENHGPLRPAEESEGRGERTEAEAGLRPGLFQSRSVLFMLHIQKQICITI